jgi:NAD(P)-dependent dehydrogenase (short-subunit alcohol dehydrogenase family)
MKNTVITGANRGIGLELTRQYLASGHSVVACCRTPELARDLKSLMDIYPDQLVMAKLDVASNVSINELSKQLRGKQISLLINNAGVCLNSEGRIGSLSSLEWTEMFLVNSISPAMLVQGLIASLTHNAKVANISSDMGSIGLCDSNGYSGYRASKAALNSITKSLSFELRPRGISIFAIHPGWVKTAMGGNEAPILVEESAKALIATIDHLTLLQSGGFFNLDGSAIHPEFVFSG